MYGLLPEVSDWYYTVNFTIGLASFWAAVSLIPILMQVRSGLLRGYRGVIKGIKGLLGAVSEVLGFYMMCSMLTVGSSLHSYLHLYLPLISPLLISPSSSQLLDGTLNAILQELLPSSQDSLNAV